MNNEKWKMKKNKKRKTFNDENQDAVSRDMWNLNKKMLLQKVFEIATRRVFNYKLDLIYP